MPSIDERIVSMVFENQVFEQRVAVTMTTLGKLDTAIKNTGSTVGLENIEKSANKVTLQAPMTALDKLKAKLGMAGQGAAEGFGEIDKAGNRVTLEGPSNAVDKLQGKMAQLSAGSTFSDIEKASNQVELGGLARALDTVTAKFSMLQGVATVALGNIASQAAMRGSAFAKSFAFGPLQQGFQEYSTNLKSIQTILANTEGQQVSGLDAVKAHLEELNRYSDQTIYNFGEMAKNIGTFTAAGVDLPTATASIKGIANLAALSGSNSQQAATAMYQLSQAIAAGRVSLQDWNSVVNAGMGGAVFQKALMKTAVAMGDLEEGAVKIDKATGKATVNGESFRNSIMAKPGEESWLTSEVLTTTLKNFTGDMKEADLIAQGFSKTQAKAIMDQAKTAKAAATEVKTISQVWDIARETIGSGWSKTFQLVFGDFEEAKKTFTSLSNFINDFINKTSAARNAVLGEWRDLGGREELIKGIKAAFDALMGILIPIKDAFRDIFPAATGKSLFEFTQNFRELMESLRPAPQTMDALRRIFAGLFAVVHIGWTVIKELAGVIFDLLGVVGKGSGGFLNFVASIGDLLVAIDTAVTKGGALKGIFETLGTVLKVPLEIIKAIASALFGMFDGADPQKAEGVASSMSALDKALRPLRGVLDVVYKGWEKFLDILEKVKSFVGPVVATVLDTLGDIGNQVAEAFTNINWDTALNALQTGLIGGIFLKLRSAFSGGMEQAQGGIFQNIKNVLQGVTDSLAAMQDTLQAATLLGIAAAIAVLAAGILILSTIDPDDLSRAMSAVAIGMGQLIAALALLAKIKVGPVQVTLVAGAMILLATAVTILAGAMKIMSTMSWEGIAKGLAGVGGAIAVVGRATQFLVAPNLLAAGAALILIATGLNIMAMAVKIFASMSWEEIGKGLFAVAEALGLIALTMSFMPPTLPLTGAGLILVAVGLTFLAGAVAAFGNLDFKVLVQGIGGIAVALLAIVAAVLPMALIGPMIGVAAVGLVLLSVALGGIAAVIGVLGNMDIGTLAKGIIAMGASLSVLATGLILMAAALPGAAALVVAAAAFAVLAPALGFLGSLSWGTIFKGLAAIALTLGTLAVVGALAAVPLIALGAAFTVLGLGITMIGAGLYLIAKGFALIGAEGAKGIAAVIAAIGAFIVIFPKMVIDFVKGLVTILQEIVKLVPSIVTALVSIVTTLLDAIVDLAPKLAEAIAAIVTNVLTIFQQNAPKLVEAGGTLLLALLTGLRNYIPQLVTTVVDIIDKFLQTLAVQIPRLVQSGVTALSRFLEGIISQIPRVVPIVARMINAFLNNVSARIPDIVKSGTNLITRFINALAENIGKVVRAGTNLIIKFLDGIEEAIPKIKKKGLSLAATFLAALADGLVTLADIGFKAIIRFLNGLERSIRENFDDLFAAGAGVADAIIDGLVDQFGKLSGLVRRVLESVFSKLPGWAKKVLGISSPSRVFMEIGKFAMQGFAKGVQDNSGAVRQSAEASAVGMISQIKKILGIHSPSEVMREIGKEVGRGFAQGLEGSAADIRNAWRGLNDRLAQDIKATRDQLKSDNAQLKEELGKAAAEQDPKLITELRKAIRQNTSDLEKMTKARQTLNLFLVIEKKELIGLSKEYEKVSARLEVAKQALEEATRERDQAAKSFADKYSDLPDIDQETDLEEYKKQLRERIIAVKQYHQTLQILRKAGLDDTTYQMLLEEGTAGQEFASQLLAGGVGAIKEINALDSDLASVAKQLGDTAAANLYNAGIKAAQGLVKGLRQEKMALQQEMDVLAGMIVNSIKRRLKIRSPSEVFAEIGKFISQGLARGLEDSSEATTAAAKLGEETLIAISSAFTDNVNVEPVISPVLDLTQVKKEASKLEDLANVTPITAAASFGQASAISTEKQAVETAAADQAVQVGPTFNYEQNNYSPEALSDVEIYRKTKNQLGQLKSALGLVS